MKRNWCNRSMSPHGEEMHVQMAYSDYAFTCLSKFTVYKFTISKSKAVMLTLNYADFRNYGVYMMFDKNPLIASIVAKSKFLSAGKQTDNARGYM